MNLPENTLHPTAVEQLVRRYYALVSDLTSTEADLTGLLDPDVR
ncbi:hypothetical protein AAIB33_11575 [Microbacterium sp. AZCO]